MECTASRFVAESLFLQLQGLLVGSKKKTDFENGHLKTFSVLHSQHPRRILNEIQKHINKTLAG